MFCSVCGSQTQAGNINGPKAGLVVVPMKKTEYYVMKYNYNYADIINFTLKNRHTYIVIEVGRILCHSVISQRANKSFTNGTAILNIKYNVSI